MSIMIFKREIKKHKGKFVPSMDLDYRFYITNLLSIACSSADEDLKAKIFSEVVVPS